MTRAVVLVGGSLLASLVAVLAARASGRPWAVAEWLFLGVVVGGLALVVEVVVGERRAARAAGRAAAELATTEPGAHAREAVREECRRLDEEISARLRSLLTEVEEVAEEVVAVAAVPVGDGGGRASSSDDLTAAVHRIQRLSREATTELRRRLGLLREEPAEGVDGGAVAAAEGTDRLGRSDLVLGAAVAAVAAVEASVYPGLDGRPVSVVAVVLTALAAATLAGRRLVPLGVAAGLGAVLLAAALVGEPTVNGFWTVATVGGLLWACGVRGPRPWWAVAVVVAVVAAVGAAQWLDDPDNVAVAVTVAVVGWVGGLVVGALARRRAGADRSAAVHREGLERARREAVAGERLAFAREIHDVVSHAVGVVAVQAAAAEVSLPTRRDRAEDALRVIAATARDTLTELDRLHPAPWPRRPRGEADVLALVERIRAAGTPVDLALDGEAPPHLRDVVHRVVQEALTNVVRHAPGAHARVEIGAEGEWLHVVVTDDGTPRTAPGAERGYGLVGLSERVVASGGRVVIGPRDGGRGFAVDALLPVGGGAR